jgi:hypothetical protein
MGTLRFITVLTLYVELDESSQSHTLFILILFTYLRLGDVFPTCFITKIL